MIDGMLGMAYGVSCRTFLIMFKLVPTSIVSAIVHYSELPTTFTTILSHCKLKNINKMLMIQLTVSEIFGVLIGLKLSLSYIKTFELIIDLYLIVIGFIILSKFFLNAHFIKPRNKNYLILGFLGAFFDTIGGGGYGPIVTGSLIAGDHDIKK